MMKLLGDGWGRGDGGPFSEFGVPNAERVGVNILLAAYDCPDYEGAAFVLFEKDGKLYEVTGSHCSCAGLEGQWKPEEVVIEELLKRSKALTYGADYTKELKAAIAEFQVGRYLDKPAR